MTRARDEGGWTLAIAMLLMAIIATMGLATFAFVDREQEESAIVRKRETAYNVAEAVLNAQIYELSRAWPGFGMASNPYPVCTETSTSASDVSRCPSVTTIKSLFSSPDTTGVTWRTEVHDNNAPDKYFYSDSVGPTGTRAQLGYDTNNDGSVWVRAQATARGKTRTLISLVKVQEQDEDLPRAALISGRLDISNQGHKIVIDAAGGSSVSGLVAVRCQPALLESTPCLGHEIKLTGLITSLTGLLNLLKEQITPMSAVVRGYAGVSMASDARDRLRARAIADGTYYTSCPSAPPSGRVVFIENAGTCPAWEGNAVANSPTSPGVMLLVNSSVTLRGNVKYYGVIYNANLNNVTSTVVEVSGNAEVHGGVLVEGNATTTVGESHLNIQLDLGAFNALKSYGSAGIIQNTFREIKSS